MNTVTFAFPVRAARQTETRLKNERAGSPLTATVPSPVIPSKQTGLRWHQKLTGNPVNLTIAMPSPLNHAQFHWKEVRTGSPATVPLAFSTALKYAELRFQNDRAGNPVNTVVAFCKLPTQKAALIWQSARHTYSTATVGFRNDYHNLVTSPVCYRYDWKTILGTALRYRHRSFVLDGWRILAKNLETNEVVELGFINSNVPNRALENVSLPDGDYEIQVLTSSLFWKDAMDGNVRTISVRPGEDFCPLPVIYNLRSSVSFGTRTIQWSASHSEIDECLFGIWYSSESPVDTNRTPDATVWYSTFMTEYQTSFAQNAPAYVAVAALRPGNESEKGKVHELYLDWSNVPPRTPDDVIVLPEPFPATDPEIADRAVEAEDLALVF